MFSSKLVLPLFTAVLAASAPIEFLHADTPLQTASQSVPSQDLPSPDEDRLTADLASHYQFAGMATLGAGTGDYGDVDSMAVSSTVRQGDVLEVRVTSLFHADDTDSRQREVVSLISYRLDNHQWRLLGVRTEGTRSLARGQAGNSSENC